MCNLSDRIYYRGIKAGENNIIANELLPAIRSFMAAQNVSVEEALRILDIPVEKRAMR